jgi:hypothetical protein
MASGTPTMTGTGQMHAGQHRALLMPTVRDQMRVMSLGTPSLPTRLSQPQSLSQQGCTSMKVGGGGEGRGAAVD